MITLTSSLFVFYFQLRVMACVQFLIVTLHRHNMLVITQTTFTACVDMLSMILKFKYELKFVMLVDVFETKKGKHLHTKKTSKKIT